MVDYENLRLTVVTGLRKYLGCPVIMNNQTVEAPPFPYVTYTITTPMTENKGTYGEYDDGKARKPVNCIWSITALSNKNTESLTLANKAREWLDFVATVHLNDNNVIVQSVGAVGNRDNLLTVGYEYKNGFDVVFWLFDVVDLPDNGTIDTLSFGEDTNAELENRLGGTESYEFSGNSSLENSEEINGQLENRLSGVE